MKMAMLLLSAYLLGSVNFAIILFNILGKNDPRDYFSGNAGVTNIYRQAGLFWAGFILLLDVGRAFAVSFASLYMLPIHYAPWIGFALVLGNRFPCYHRFRGGKGVANYLGFTFLIAPISTVLSVIIWTVVYLVFRIPFIASFFMIIVLVIGTIIACGYQPAATMASIATFLFIFYNHRRNIKELFHK